MRVQAGPTGWHSPGGWGLWGLMAFSGGFSRLGCLGGKSRYNLMFRWQIEGEKARCRKTIITIALLMD